MSFGEKSGVAGQSLPPGCQQPVVNDDFGDVYGVLFRTDWRRAIRSMTYRRSPRISAGSYCSARMWGESTSGAFKQKSYILRSTASNFSQLGLDPNVIFSAIQQQNAITETGKTTVGSEDIRLRVTGDLHRC